jgi:hypothetical protein
VNTPSRLIANVIYFLVVWTAMLVPLVLSGAIK